MTWVLKNGLNSWSATTFSFPLTNFISKLNSLIVNIHLFILGFFYERYLARVRWSVYIKNLFPRYKAQNSGMRGRLQDHHCQWLRDDYNMLPHLMSVVWINDLSSCNATKTGALINLFFNFINASSQSNNQINLSFLASFVWGFVIWAKIGMCFL